MLNLTKIADNDDFLYNQIAERLASQMEASILKTGDKLLSLRALSKEQGVSLSTAYKAYVELENKGLIEARPKSGYFVKFTSSQFPSQPAVALQPVNVNHASVDDLIRHVYKTL